MAKQPITCVSIDRIMQSTHHGIWKTTRVTIHRSANVKGFETNPLTDRRGKISDFSVIRAKNAQLALMERAQAAVLVGVSE